MVASIVVETIAQRHLGRFQTLCCDDAESSFGSASASPKLNVQVEWPAFREDA